MPRAIGQFRNPKHITVLIRKEDFSRLRRMLRRIKKPKSEYVRSLILRELEQHERAKGPLQAGF
jgi:hypothetical protein